MSATFVDCDHSIQVAGFTCYPENRWREAILAFLFAMWRGDRYVLGRPKICFGCLDLRLDPEKDCYFAYGKGSNSASQLHKDVCGGLVLGISNSRLEVENALIRFVKDEKIRVLQIFLREGSIALWKKVRRGEYGCWSSDEVPKSWMGLGAYVG